MAGQTRGTYRSKSAGGSGIPEPPVIDFFWLKQWWPMDGKAKPPHSHDGRRKERLWKIIRAGLLPLEFWGFSKTHVRKQAENIRPKIDWRKAKIVIA